MNVHDPFDILELLAGCGRMTRLGIRVMLNILNSLMLDVAMHPAQEQIIGEFSTTLRRLSDMGLTYERTMQTLVNLVDDMPPRLEAQNV